jgi:hypothetical protein
MRQRKNLVAHKAVSVSAGRAQVGKPRGDLAATLDPQLTPRRPPGHPGRPVGAGNYRWTPEDDRHLIELCERLGTSKAKVVMAGEIRNKRTHDLPSSFEAVRKVVERRMTRLEIPPTRPRKRPAVRKVNRWTDAQITTLLGCLGADADIKSIAKRTQHSVKGVRSKIARLLYKNDELTGFEPFTAKEVAELIQVSPRKIRRWKERGWLKTVNHRVTRRCLERFLRSHADQVPFASSNREQQVKLMDLGYPCAETKQFKKNVSCILGELLNLA